MKLFVTWSPYDVSPLLSEYVDGYSISLALFNRRKLEIATTIGLKRLLNIDKELIVDSLATPIRSAGLNPFDLRSQPHLFNIQLWLAADYIVHKDYPILNKSLSEKEKRKLLDMTIKNAEIMFRLEEEYGGGNIIYVIQGWDLRSVAYCARRYLDIGIKMFGLGSTIGLGHREFAERIKKVREIIGWNRHLHIFGALKPYHIELVRQHADSVDTSTPIKVAAMGYVLVQDDDRVRRMKIKKINLEDLELPSRLKSEIEQVAETLRKRDEDRPPITMLKRVLAAANAYTLMTVLKK